MRTFALYLVPDEGSPATRYTSWSSQSARAAREKRSEVCDGGTKVAVHAGEDHPLVLPFGETLWREPSHD